MHDDPITILEKEHEAALDRLQTLDDILRPYEVSGAPALSAGDVRAVTEILAFIGTEVREHNLKEEVALFPLLEEHVHGPTDCMRDEHRILWDHLEGARSSLDQAAPAKEALLGHCRAIIDLLSAHIAKENEVLFPMARQVLDQDEMRTVGSRMEPRSEWI